jgi:hypothetical protein
MYKIPKELLIQQYVIEKQTLKAISKQVGCSWQTIRRAINKYGLKLRPNDYNFQDLTKQGKFGRLTPIKRDGVSCPTKWICECDCGIIISVCRESLVKGLTQSCGCLWKERIFKGCGRLSQSYWNRVIKGAKSRNLEISITIEDAWQKFIEQNEKCALTGMDIQIVTDYTRKHNEHTASLDRIDSTKGYTLENIQWVHRDINILKQDFDEQTFIELCQKVVNHAIIKELNKRTTN